MKLEINAEEKTKPQSTEKTTPQEMTDEEPTTEYIEQAPRGLMVGLLAMILTTCYAGYILWHFYSLGIDDFSNYITTLIVMPHLLCVTVATVLSFVGYFEHKRWAMLTCGILMLCSAVALMEYAPMVIVQAILFFFAYGLMA